MTDSHGDPPGPGQPDIRAGRDVFVAGRDLTVYLYSEDAGPDARSLMAASGGIREPYRGLRPFGEQDEALFFGRERAVTRVLELLSERCDGSGLLVVSGVSGAGKSSLLRAGVLPALRRSGLASAPSARSWRALVLNPGRTPLAELADGIARMLPIPASQLRAELAADPANFAALAKQAALSLPEDRHVDASPADGPRLLLIVDQCEQLFTQCGPQDRQAFLTALYSASAGARDRPPAMIVLVIRGDFETSLADYRPGDFPELGQAVQDRYLLRAMNDRELRLAITGPAAKAGFRVAEDLVQVLIGEMRAGPEGDGQGEPAIGAGALPFLSHALDQAWRERSGPDLGLADYNRIGGIQKAIALTAQSAYDALTPAQQKAAPSVFIRLTATSSEGADTAIRVPVTDLTAGLNPAQSADVEAVLSAFASSRLLTMGSSPVAKGHGTVEISHESLLTAWPLLRDTWLAQTHADRITRTRLRTAAADWERSRDPAYLYRGTLLEAARETADRTAADPVRNPPLGRAEREFLDASTQASGRAARLRRAGIAGLATLTLAASAFAGVALYNATNANHQHAVALSRQLAADSLAQDQANPQVAGQLATAAWQVSNTDQAKDAMLNAVAGQQEGALPGNSAVRGVAFSPDGRLPATVGDDGTARLWNTATNLPVGKPLRAGNLAATGVAFSPDDRLLATADANGTVRLWDSATGRPVGKPITVSTASGGSISVNGEAFSPDGKLLATADQNGTARLWNPSTGQPVGKPITVSPRISMTGVAFGSDGRLLATAEGDGTARLWDPATGQPVGKLITASKIGLNGVAFSRDGKLLATAGQDDTVRLWDPATGRPVGKPIVGSGGGGVWGVAFSPDGKLLATAGGDGTARLLDPATGQPTGPPLPASTGTNLGVTGVAFSPDGRLLATAADDGTVRLWDPVTGQPIGKPLPAADPGSSRNGGTNGVAFSPDGSLLETATQGGPARLLAMSLFKNPYHVLCADFGAPTSGEWAQYARGEPLPKVCS